MPSNIKKFIRTIPDFPHKGIQFRDITTLFNSSKGLQETVNEMAKAMAVYNFDQVAGLEARGFMLGAALAQVSDAGQIAPKIKSLFDQSNIRWEENTHSTEEILQADLVMKSPGIPEHVAIVKAIRAAAIPIHSEIEFASQFTQAKIIGITGSNGKTTTTLLIHHLLKIYSRHQ